MRPVLTPSVRPLWRDPETLQLGRPPGRSAVLAGVDPSLRTALTLLDGTRDHAQLLTAASAAGCAAARTNELLDLLHASGLLDDAGQDRAALAHLPRAERDRLGGDLPSLALVRGDGGLPALEHRRAASVLICGGGRVGAPLAVALALAGVGLVDVDDDGLTRAEDVGAGGLQPSDVGRNRGEAARQALYAAVPSLPQTAMPAPDLVVLTNGGRDDVRRWQHQGTAHLPAEVRDTTGVVGPLVLPGRTPCLQCLDLTRSDLDPAWPALAAQLASGPPRRAGCDGPLAMAVASQAAMQVLAMIDGTTEPATLGGTLELTLPDWRWRRRTWPAHPECGCIAV